MWTPEFSLLSFVVRTEKVVRVRTFTVIPQKRQAFLGFVAVSWCSLGAGSFQVLSIQIDCIELRSFRAHTIVMGWTVSDLARTILRKVPPSCVSVSNGEPDFIGNFRVWKPFGNLCVRRINSETPGVPDSLGEDEPSRNPRRDDYSGIGAIFSLTFALSRIYASDGSGTFTKRF